MMALADYLIDTHALYWHRISSPKLSAAAAAVFSAAVAGQAILVVSHVVVAEMYYLLQKQSQSALFASVLSDLKTIPYYRLEPILLADIEELDNFPEIPEMHDRLIAIQAKRLNVKLVTKDRTIHASPQVTCIW